MHLQVLACVTIIRPSILEVIISDDLSVLVVQSTAESPLVECVSIVTLTCTVLQALAG